MNVGVGCVYIKIIMPLGHSIILVSEVYPYEISSSESDRGNTVFEDSLGMVGLRMANTLTLAHDISSTL